MNSLQDILPHVGADSLDNCMAEVLPNLIPCLGSARVSVRKAAIQVKYSVGSPQRCVYPVSVPVDSLLPFHTIILE